MVFNGSTNAFSNTGFVFPYASYSLFAVYSNTTAPASTAYMNVAYGSNGYPMIGVYDSNQYVTARSVVGNTGALTTIAPGGWATRITGTGSEFGNGIATDSAGNIVIIGQRGTDAPILYNANGSTGATLSGGGGGDDCFIAKYTPDGYVTWTAQIRGGGNDYGNKIATDMSGNLLAYGIYNGAPLTLLNAAGTTGATLSSNEGNYDCFIAKYSPTGEVTWAAQIGGTGSDTPGSIATDSNGNVLVTGNYRSTSTFYSTNRSSSNTLSFTGNVNAFIAKYTPSGTLSWVARVTSANSNIGNSIAADSSGNVYIAGYYNSAITFYSADQTVGPTFSYNAGLWSGYFAKYSSTGSFVWGAKIESAGFQQAFGIATDSSNNVYVSGIFNAALNFYNSGGSNIGGTIAYRGGTSAFIAKYSSEGSFIWAVEMGEGYTGGSDIKIDSNGDVCVIGFSFSAVKFYNIGGTIGTTIDYTANQETFVAKYTSAGNVRWAARVGGPSNEGASGVATDSYGNVIIAGNYGAAATVYNADATTAATLAFGGVTDGYIAKYSPTGFITSYPFKANSNVIVGTTYSPSTALIPYTNGVSMTALSGTVAATTGLYLGGSSNYFNGTLSELVVFSNALSSSQRQQIEGYLAWKWGLQGSLPGSHVFRSVAMTSSNATLASPLYYEVTPADWTQSWQPYLQSLAAANASGVTATFSSNVVTGAAPGGSAYYGGVLAPNGKIYTVPFLSGYGGVIDTVSNTFTSNALSGTIPTFYPYGGGVLAPNGKIYCMSQLASNIGVIDPGLNAFTTFGTAGSYTGGVLAPDGKIYCIPRNGTVVGVIDPAASPNTFTTFGTAPAGTAYVGGVLAPNGKIYCIPCNGTFVGLIDPTVSPATFTSNAITGAGAGGFSYIGGVLAPNGKIYCIPYNATTVGVIDPVLNTFSSNTVTGTAPGSGAYIFGVLGPDGKIYCIPGNATGVGVINPVLNTFTSNAIPGTAAGGEAYLGGILAPNGNIYCMPYNTGVGVISFTGLKQLPSSNYCLSAWANKI
jgi:hypothetical protein